MPTRPPPHRLAGRVCAGGRQEARCVHRRPQHAAKVQVRLHPAAGAAQALGRQRLLVRACGGRGGTWEGWCAGVGRLEGMQQDGACCERARNMPATSMLAGPNSSSPAGPPTHPPPQVRPPAVRGQAREGHAAAGRHGPARRRAQRLLAARVRLLRHHQRHGAQRHAGARMSVCVPSPRTRPACPRPVRPPCGSGVRALGHACSTSARMHASMHACVRSSSMPALVHARVRACMHACAAADSMRGQGVGGLGVAWTAVPSVPPQPTQPNPGPRRAAPPHLRHHPQRQALRL
jgi:hypothetical protein